MSRTSPTIVPPTRSTNSCLSRPPSRSRALSVRPSTRWQSNSVGLEYPLASLTRYVAYAIRRLRDTSLTRYVAYAMRRLCDTSLDLCLVTGDRHEKRHTF